MKLKVKLVGTAPYSPSKALLNTERDSGEDWTDHSERTWKEHLHLNTKKQVVMPVFGLKAMLDSTAQFLGMKVEGAGKRTYTKIFAAGVVLQGENPLLMVDAKPITEDQVTLDEHGEWVYCHSDGKRNGTAGRVNRLFPKFENWETEFTVETIDPRITETVLVQHLVAAGKFNGMGRFRPQNGGCLGRFEVLVNGKKPTVKEVELQED